MLVTFSGDALPAALGCWRILLGEDEQRKNRLAPAIGIALATAFVATMVMMQIQVPDGVYQGDPMSVSAGNQEFTITVPDGVGPGDMLEVDLPVEEEGAGSSEAPPSSVEVVIPDGCFPGMEFTVQFDGREFNIAVPDGCEPGMALNVEVPAEEPAPPARPPPPPPARTPWELVGRRAALCGLIAKAILNGRKGTVRSYNAEKDRLVMTIDGMHPGVPSSARALVNTPMRQHAAPATAMGRGIARSPASCRLTPALLLVLLPPPASHARRRCAAALASQTSRWRSKT